MIGFSFQSSISVWQTIYFAKFIRFDRKYIVPTCPFVPPPKRGKNGGDWALTKELEGVEKISYSCECDILPLS